MNTKLNNKKQNVSKKEKENHLLSFHEKVAKMSKCSAAYARMVLDGTRSSKSAKAQRILVNAQKIMESDNELLKEVQKIAPPITSREKSTYGDSKVFIEKQ